MKILTKIVIVYWKILQLEIGIVCVHIENINSQRYAMLRLNQNRDEFWKWY